LHGLWHCFGCQQGGSVIDWVMKTEGVSFRHAVELLRDDNASLATAAAMRPAGPHSRTTRAGLGLKSTVPKLKNPLDLKADDRELLKQVIDYYHETLKEIRKRSLIWSSAHCEAKRQLKSSS
jgi:DNA primase